MKTRNATVVAPEQPTRLSKHRQDSMGSLWWSDEALLMSERTSRQIHERIAQRRAHPRFVNTHDCDCPKKSDPNLDHSCHCASQE